MSCLLFSFFFFCPRHCAEYNSLRFLTANHPYRVHKFLIIRLVRRCTKHIDWENKHTEAHFLPCLSVRPRFTNWKFGRDKFCREFWKGETNFVSPVRPDPKTDRNFRCKITYYAVHRRSCCWIEILKYKFPNLKDVRANCFCASLLRTRITCHVMHRARALSTKMNKWKGRRPLLQLCLELTILDVRWPVLFFSETDFIYNYLHIVQNWTKNQCGKLKKNSRFLSTGHGILPSCGCKYLCMFIMLIILCW